MRYSEIHAMAGQRTLVAVLATGDEVVASLCGLAARERLSAAQVTAIGAFERAVLAWFDWQARDYEHLPLEEQAEVLSLNGDIALVEDGTPRLHVHAVLGRRDGSTFGGHVISGHVRPTLEVIITEQPAHLRRRYDPRSGLALIDPTL